MEPALCHMPFKFEIQKIVGIIDLPFCGSLKQEHA